MPKTLTEDKSKESISKDVFTTTQLLEESVLGDNTTKEYATTAIVDITSADLTKTTSNMDEPTCSYRAYSTIYWTETSINGITYSKLTRASGGWTRLDSQVNLVYGYVLLGEIGTGENGLPVDKELPVEASGNTFNNYVNWPYINTQGQVPFGLGVNTTGVLVRGSTSWTIEHNNHYQN